MTGYIYIRIGKTYEVGFYMTKYSYDNKPYNQWHMETAWATADEAAARIHYLNGGNAWHPAIVAANQTTDRINHPPEGD